MNSCMDRRDTAAIACTLLGRSSAPASASLRPSFSLLTESYLLISPRLSRVDHQEDFRQNILFAEALRFSAAPQPDRLQWSGAADPLSAAPLCCVMSLGCGTRDVCYNSLLSFSLELHSSPFA